MQGTAKQVLQCLSAEQWPFFCVSWLPGDRAPKDTKSSLQMRLELNYLVPKQVTFGICTSLLEAHSTKQRDDIDYIQPDHFGKETK